VSLAVELNRCTVYDDERSVLEDVSIKVAAGRVERTWEVKVPRSQRQHHPALRPLENELRERLHVAHIGYQQPDAHLANSLA
jgi:hypothetical protein